MRGKRGQVFSVYLVFVTLVMCAMAIIIYYHQQGIISNSIISPVGVLRLEDKKEIFEMQEELMVKQAVKTAGSQGAKEEFVKLAMNSTMKDFIFSDFYYRGQEIDKKAYDEDGEKINFLNDIYDFKDSGGIVEVTRKDFGKYERLRAPELWKINFATNLVWNFGERKISAEIPQIINMPAGP